MANKKYTQELNSWIEGEQLAARAISIIHQLWSEHSVELMLFRRVLVDEGTVEVLAHHNYASQISQTKLRIQDTLPIIDSLASLSLCPSTIDIGRLALEWRAQQAANSEMGLRDFLKSRLGEHLKPNNACSTDSRDVVLYGFGRIGRLLARILLARGGASDALRLRAVVCRGKLDMYKRANLLKRDSVHGLIHGHIEIREQEQALVVNGHYIQFISANTPESVDYEQYDIHNALVIDNTGIWRTRAELGKHLEARGVERVLLTAPGKEDIPNIVYGVNTDGWDADEHIFSAASCTTNAIAPPLKVLNDHFGIHSGHIETVHAYTNDQNLLDNYHKKQRRGRSAPLNMVLTETGAATAAAKAMPELAGKMTSNAVRVPTPNVSLAILSMELKQTVTREGINDALRQASLSGPLASQIDYTRDEDVVSSDMIGNNHPAIVDSLATKVHKQHVIIYVWYDNEYGYSTQATRVARVISGVERPRYY